MDLPHAHNCLVALRRLASCEPSRRRSGMRVPVAGCSTPPRSAPGSMLPQKFSKPRGRRRLFGIDSQRRNSSRSCWLALSSS